MIFEDNDMTNQPTLYLHEEILLLALKDEKGTVAESSMYPYAIGGAVLAELLLRNRIRVDEVKKNKRIHLVDSTPVGDPLIDECLERIRTSKKPALLQTWVTRFSGVKGLKHRVAQQLCRRGILRADEDKVLHLFKRKIYPEVDPGPERALIERMRQAILTDADDVDPRTVVLISLAKSADLLKTALDKKDIKKRKARIEQLTNGELTGKAAKEAIQAMQAAVFVATIIPSVVVTTTVSH